MSRRRLAARLVRHALAVMPPERRGWALGMIAEVDHIEDDGAALAFALGAVWTGYRQAARRPSNWLRLGRWGAALWTALLGIGLFAMSVWLQRLPEAAAPSVPFSGLMVALGCGYLAAGWSLARRETRLLAVLVVGMTALLTVAALALAASAEAADPWAAYAALLRGDRPPAGAYYAALLLEEFVFTALLAAAGAVLWRFDRPSAGR